MYKVCILSILEDMVSLQSAHVEYPEHAQRSGGKTNLMKGRFNMKGSKKFLLRYKASCSKV